MEDRSKDLRLAELSDYYKGLLTDKQREIFDLYYNMDCSLAEISESLGIARQSVRDSLEASRDNLLKYEQQLGLLEKFTEIRRLCAEGSSESKEPGTKNILDRIAEIAEV